MLAGGIYERTSGAAGQPLRGGYQRRTPEHTVLHELVSRHAQTMLAELRDADGRGLPRYVDRELAEYLPASEEARAATFPQAELGFDHPYLLAGYAPPEGERVEKHTSASDGSPGMPRGFMRTDMVFPVAPFRGEVASLSKTVVGYLGPKNYGGRRASRVAAVRGRITGPGAARQARVGRFGRKVHPRSIERARPTEKKRPR